MTKRSVSQRPAPLFFHRDDMNRNMSGFRVVLQTIENGPTVAIGQTDVEGDCRRGEFVGQRERHLSGCGYQTLESLFACEIQKNIGKRHIIFDN